MQNAKPKVESSALEQWRQRCERDLQADNEFEVFSCFVDLAAELGYRRVAYGLELPNSVARPDFCYFANFLADWRPRYAPTGSIRDNAKVALGKRSSVSDGDDERLWRRDDFEREANMHNVRFNSLTTLPGRAGTSSVIGLADAAGAPTDLADEKRNCLIAILVRSMVSHLLPQHLPQFDIELTRQECQCLKWVLDGKTAEEIAGILGSRKSLVQLMQRNLTARFQKSGIFVTAVLAYRIGLLELEAHPN